jgi:hypothetical protein
MAPWQLLCLACVASLARQGLLFCYGWQQQQQQHCQTVCEDDMEQQHAAAALGSHA